MAVRRCFGLPLLTTRLLPSHPTLQLMQNPELMQSMMQSPFMQNMLDNPELMRNMLMSNPGYRQVSQKGEAASKGRGGV